LEAAGAPGSRACRVEDVPTELIRFGVTPYVGTELVTRQFEPILAHLARETGLSFTMVMASDYKDLLRLLLDGRVDVASLSPLLYVEALEKQPCIRLLATQVSAGATYYSSYILVLEDSPFESVEDLEGRRFAFGSSSSASGYLFPLTFLLDRGIGPDRFFGEVVYARDHLDALRMLLARRVDAVATFARVLQPARSAGLDVGNLRVLAVAGRVPFDAMVAREGLHPETASRVQKAILQLNSATREGRSVLAGVIELGGWVVSEDSFYEPVRERLRKVRERSAE
jgi:phosphate/phosphite/phosphonate ABC transporter binding protein